MGADLYRDDFDAHRKTVKANGGTFDAIYTHPYYFRDSYNDSSLLRKIGMSWSRDLNAYADDNATLHPDGARRFADEIAKRAESLAFNVRDLPDDTGPDGDLDKRYFLDKLDRLLDFLRTTADEGRTIDCSV